MTPPQITVIAILSALLGLMIWGRWRHDVVAIAALLAAVLTGLVPAGQAFDGFGHPATITVALVLVLSRALALAGATDLIARVVTPATANTTSHVAVTSGLGAVLSTLMNNIGALGLLLPVATQSARKAKRATGLLLMPLSFGCILGGLVTLIGTPPNIIVANYRGQVAERAFGMFDYAPVGGTVALVGVIFVALLGWRLVPQRSTRTADDLFNIDDYVTEARVPEQSAAVGKTAREIEEMTTETDARVFGLVRQDGRLVALGQGDRVRAGDVLMVEAGPDEIDRFVAALDLELTDAEGRTKIVSEDANSELVEAVVGPRAWIAGRTFRSLHPPGRHDLNILAVSRQGKPYRGRLRQLRFQVGDLLLIHGEEDRVDDAVAALGCLPLRTRSRSFGRRSNPVVPVAIFAGAIVAASLGIVSIPVALSLAVLAMVVGNLLPLRELYDAIDWPIVVMLAALLPLGGALESTGTIELIAAAILALTSGLSPVIVLVLLMIVTMTISDVLNNAATAVVMAPIAYTLATRLDLNPDSFLMAVAVGASSAFLTPIGHQNNALVMGPGGYRFGDYWRMGLPLEVLIVAVALPAILLFWPLNL